MLARQPAGRPPFLLHLGAFGLLLLVSLLAFGTALNGEWVYDDLGQILNNHLIQDIRRLPEALASDVWAYKGERAEAWSRFWRPGFTAWLAIQYQLFGLESTFGWHLASIVLHTGVAFLALLLAVRIGLSYPLALTLAAIFAVHPVHAESVAWISGSPDLLASLFLLASLLLVAPSSEKHHRARYVAALLCFALALASKEMAVLGPVLIAAYLVAQGERPRAALLRALPFAALVPVYLLARAWVLGEPSAPIPGGASALESLLSIPRLLGFYAQQLLLPLWIAPAHPVRAARWEDLATATWWIGALATVLAVALAAFLARDRPRLFALALLCLPLLPALNIGAFHPERVVQDRYLYLPVLGALLLVFLMLLHWRPALRKTLTVAGAITAIVLIPLTASQAGIWASHRALWTAAVEGDPNSASAWAGLAQVHYQEKRLTEANTAADRALALAPVTVALQTRAQVALATRRPDLAEADTRRILASHPDSLAYELLAMALQQQGRPDEAIAVLTGALDALPHRRCSLLSNRAVLHYQNRNRQAAHEDLVIAVRLVETEPTVPCLRSLIHLGNLEREAGRPDVAATHFQRFLHLTGHRREPELTSLRAFATRHGGG